MSKLIKHNLCEVSSSSSLFGLCTIWQTQMIIGGLHGQYPYIPHQLDMFLISSNDMFNLKTIDLSNDDSDCFCLLL